MLETEIIVALLAGLSASFLKPVVDAVIASFKHRDERKEKKEDEKDQLQSRVDALEHREKDFTEDIMFCKGATHLLLKDRTLSLTAQAVAKGEITIATKAFIFQAVDLLHEDGENGEMTACKDAIEELKVV